MNCRFEFADVDEANEALNEFVGERGYNDWGQDHEKPDGTRGPVVVFHLGDFELMFSVNRGQKGWAVTAVWLIRFEKAISVPDLLQGFLTYLTDEYTEIYMQGVDEGGVVTAVEDDYGLA